MVLFLLMSGNHPEASFRIVRKALPDVEQVDPQDLALLLLPHLVELPVVDGSKEHSFDGRYRLS
ncbi:hypothetical protein [Arthrobacter livingstonensis]|uniref:hypothetical protein n=1 Tax=Arthrobacter livingstonensis TaxID=670078 RepID=UPI001B867E40|nr:hypothetical protein [Arthrobacter livingstonensis]